MAKRHRCVRRLIDATVDNPEGMDTHLYEALQLCERMETTLRGEEKRLDEALWAQAKDIPEVQRLMTIPAVGEKVAVTIYAWVGDVTRFKTARELASYAGLVPSVWQSGESQRQGGITKMGSPQLRSILTQAAHVLMFRCRSEESAPLRAIAARVHTARARRKIAVIAAARHILRIAYYVLRDGTTYDPQRLNVGVKQEAEAA
jgi:transposase